MNPEFDSQHLLDRLNLRHPCDLDLLLFFARHPRTLLGSEQLTGFMGYPAGQVADSVDVLVGAGVLACSASPHHTAQMYVFPGSGREDASLLLLVQMVSTREGRLMMRDTMTRTLAEGTNGSPMPQRTDHPEPTPRAER